MNKDLGYPYTGFVERNMAFYNVVVETVRIVNGYQQKLKRKEIKQD